MEPVFRAPMGPTNAELGHRLRETLPGLAKARRPVFALSRSNHKGQSWGCSPNYKNNRWRVGCRRQPSDAPSQMPWKFLRRKFSCVTGCRKMPLQNLEPCESTGPGTVLRGLDAGDGVWLPGTQRQRPTSPSPLQPGRFNP